ncbi:Nicotinate-nucleotide adenylyltransferase [Rhodobacteraceae bacterium THAF1]|uniref:nicotinate-nucleotide adenylyltransferase n=1 Tax=Palleronia sp. THAF1 TaxID=2587842 RepID=UPI000F3DE901|nr:nicotinate-nucleotide adenylyltransferase [Palleronia sp. THAF1]QFU07531.1 Nicotinate-nucleotide adenylyltransferase [Palleronia sp. THAF1]VDC20494.1 Nicotinate-nucleotide adenylyltransferase [Rhodobacteraceae bacterium THAF1]
MNGPGWPMTGADQVIGLLGGSFDPAHAGHVAITRAALRRFGLAQVWWLVSPGNPLKPDAPAALQTRLEAARRVMGHPRVRITDLESRLGTRLTVETIAALQARYHRTRFVWLMGADNLAQFHRWDRWQEIASRVPMGVLARPGDRIRALRSPAARALSCYRVSPGILASVDAPAWSFVNIPMRQESSSALRAAGTWKH